MHVSPTNYEWNVFFFLSITTLVFLCQSWINLVKRKTTTFSLDAIVLFLISVLGGKKRAKRARILSRDPVRIKRIGIMALIMAR